MPVDTVKARVIASTDWRPPKRFVIQPAVGMLIAIAINVAVNAHENYSMPAERSPRICGNTTLTTVMFTVGRELANIVDMRMAVRCAGESVSNRSLTWSSLSVIQAYLPQSSRTAGDEPARNSFDALRAIEEDDQGQNNERRQSQRPEIVHISDHLCLSEDLKVQSHESLNA